MLGLQRSSYAVTNRSFNFLQKRFYPNMLNISELQGKTFLDIGSGKSDLVTELRKRGVNAVSIDMQRLKPQNADTHVRGLADQMPFKDKVFDYIYSTWSLFTYGCESSQVQINALKESYRVLKQGGVLRLSPVRAQTINERLIESRLPFKITKNNKLTALSAIEITKFK